MSIEVTQGIKVSAITEYQPFYSDPDNIHYVFSYRISIENNADFTIKIVSRHWDIIDGFGNKYSVDGQGVVGLQPVIEPGSMHQYVSGCNFQTNIGQMSGHYVVEKIIDGSQIMVTIPAMYFSVPYLLN